MPKDTDVKQLIINQLTKEQYNSLKDNNQLSNTELYIITDDKHLTDEELIEILKTKQDKLTTSGVLSIDENNVLSIDLTDYYTKTETDNLLDDKANKSEAGYSIEYIGTDLILKDKDGNTLSTAKITSNPEVDKISISYNKDNNLQSIGEITKRETPKYTWIGTTAEYEQALQDGNIIDEYTEILITDSSVETVTPTVTFDAPTKLSELANDTNFITQNDIQNLTQKIEDLENNIPDDTNIVHKTGNEHIDGFKSFTETITIKNGSNTGKISHKNTTSDTPNIEDGYIRFGDNTLVYGKQSEQGDLYNTENDIFHKGNLVAGENITITEQDGVYSINSEGSTEPSTNVLVDNETIVKNDEDIITTVGQKTVNNGVYYDWIGTKEEYNTAIENNQIQPNWICYITDDYDGITEPTDTIKQGGLEIGDIGITSFIIDESKGLRRYLNGSILDINNNTQKFKDKLKATALLYPSIICTESEWQSIASVSVGGQCGKFVLDETSGTIRLPKIIMPIQGLTDLTKLGEIVEAGLPSIKIKSSGTGENNNLWHRNYPINITGIARGDGIVAESCSGVQFEDIGVLDTTIYGNSNTVQAEQIQYPYFIQIATGLSETVDITNEYELNNPFFFGMSEYFTITPNNSSWLKSNGQWNNGVIYQDYYNWTLENFNNGISGFKSETRYIFRYNEANPRTISTRNPHIGQEVYVIISSSESIIYCGEISSCTNDSFTLFDEYVGEERTYTFSEETTNYPNIWITDYDFVINTENQTFKLPLLNGSEDLPSDKLENLILQASGTNYIAPANGYIAFSKTVSNTQFISIANITANIGTVETSSGNQIPSINLQVKKGDTYQVNYSGTGATNYFRFVYAKSDGTLYFYVGETNKKLSQINTGRILEVLSDASKSYLIETYENNGSGYRVYSDGWCEQWGYMTSTNSSALLTFLKPFRDTNYYFNRCNNSNVNGTATNFAQEGWIEKTTTSISLFTTPNYCTAWNWKAEGYIK